jgi:hypothetical protein
MNSLHTIYPYKFHGQWVFDDADKGLAREPFVMGADTIIDRLTSKIEKAGDGFILIFSAHAFPGSTALLQLCTMKAETGHWYMDMSSGIVGWLCPALLKYFHEAPEYIWVTVRKKE